MTQRSYVSLFGNQAAAPQRTATVATLAGLTGLTPDEEVWVSDFGEGRPAMVRVISTTDGTYGNSVVEVVGGLDDHGKPWEPGESVRAEVSVRTAPEPDPLSSQFGETFLWISTADRTTGGAFDIAEKAAGWRRDAHTLGQPGVQQPQSINTLESRETSVVDISFAKHWQTFVPGVTGDVLTTSLEVFAQNGGPFDVLVEIFEGDPNTGTLVQSGLISAVDTGRRAAGYPVVWNTTPRVEVGKNYTLSATAQTGAGTLVWTAGTDSYPNGAADTTPPNDHRFEMTIQPVAPSVLPTAGFRGDNGAQIVETDNLYWIDETVGAAPVAIQGARYRTGVVQSTAANYDSADPDPVIWTQYVAVEDPAAPGNYYWSPDIDLEIGGNTPFSFITSDRLQRLNFTVHDRRSRFEGTRRERDSLTLDELTTPTAGWTSAPNPPYTRLTKTYTLSGVDYDFRVDWRFINDEYEFVISDRHANRTNRYGEVSDVTIKYSDADPPKANWQPLTAYPGDPERAIVVGTAPAGVGETAGEKYFIEAPAGGRPNTVAAMDAAEWGLWTVIGALQVFGSGDRVVDGAATENLHSYTIKVPESQVFIVPTGVTQTFLLNQDPATVTVENHTNGLYSDIDVAVTSKTVTLVGPARLTYTVNHILAERLQTAATISYQDTADGQTLEWNKYYILHPTFNYTFPLVTETAGSNWLVALPSNQNWQAFTGTWSGSGTDTVGAGQLASITAESDAIRFVGSLGAPSNVVLHVGGDATAPLFESIETRAGLPDPTTVPSGTIYNVTNDTAALSGLVTAFGPVAGNALGWSS